MWLRVSSQCLFPPPPPAAVTATSLTTTITGIAVMNGRSSWKGDSTQKEVIEITNNNSRVSKEWFNVCKWVQFLWHPQAVALAHEMMPNAPEETPSTSPLKSLPALLISVLCYVMLCYITLCYVIYYILLCSFKRI